MSKFILPGTMPGMNEIVAAAKAAGRSHYGGGYATMKRGFTEAVKLAAHGVPPVERATIRCNWFAPDIRRDPDNIEAAIKFILDGLVQARVLPGDGWKYIAGIEHTFAVDRENPRVEVEILEPQLSKEAVLKDVIEDLRGVCNAYKDAFATLLAEKAELQKQLDTPTVRVKGSPVPVARNYGYLTDPKICENERCKAEFIPVRTTQKYCSKRCEKATTMRNLRKREVGS